MASTRFCPPVQVVSVGYCVLSLFSFRKIFKVYTHDNNGIENNVLWAVLAASFIGPVMVIAFFFFGFFILLKKTIAESGLTYSYGALHMSSIWMAVVVLQSAVALHGQKTLMQDFWQKKRALSRTGYTCCGADFATSFSIWWGWPI